MTCVIRRRTRRTRQKRGKSGTKRAKQARNGVKRGRKSVEKSIQYSLLQYGEVWHGDCYI